MKRVDIPWSERCAAVVYKRDTWRVDGRKRRRFRMHYTRDRCGRRPAEGCGKLCAQHHRMGSGFAIHED